MDEVVKLNLTLLCRADHDAGKRSKLALNGRTRSSECKNDDLLG